PDIEQYKKLAKDLLRVAKSRDSDSIRKWSATWVNGLVARTRVDIPLPPARIESWIRGVAAFAADKLSHGGNLSHAQFVIARSHGFPSWPRFARYIRNTVNTESAEGQFEAAADAIVTGDIESLRRLLHSNPELVHMRSSREHHATLLHYVSANGVEGYRQKTPKNIVQIAKILLDAGAEVDAACDVYGGSCTTLGLAATSVHPEKAGVMNELLQLLLDQGARMDEKGSAGNDHGLVFACVANGQPGAARFLAGKGAHVDFVSAAALDRLEDVEKYFNSDGGRGQAVSRKLLQEAFRYACGYGATRVLEFLLERGADIAEHCGDGFTGAHYAAMYGHLETLKLLLRHNPPLEVQTARGGTVLGHALQAAARHNQSSVYLEIAKELIAAGAAIPEKHPPVNPKMDALLREHGSRT